VEFKIIILEQNNQEDILMAICLMCTFIDGQALTPTDFGEFDADSGVWKPIVYEGTYGTNGFFFRI
jgi:hypothetical protein